MLNWNQAVAWMEHPLAWTFGLVFALKTGRARTSPAVAAAQMIPRRLAPANPAGRVEKLVFFFCAASLTSRDGGLPVSHRRAVEFWVTAQPPAIAGFALAAPCQFSSCDILRWAFLSQPAAFPSHLASPGARAAHANSLVRRSYLLNRRFPGTAPLPA